MGEVTTMEDDSGRVPVGAILTVLAIAAAAWGAYWFLQQFGVVGGEEPSPSPTVAGPVELPDDRPAWLQGSPFDMPAEITPEDERWPRWHLMQDWIWELVDEDWDATVIGIGEGDNYTWLVDAQAVFLESPTGELFHLYDVREDFVIDVVHWDPVRHVAWLSRGGRPGIAQVVQFDLRTGETTEAWDRTVAPVPNRISGGIGNVEVADIADDGRELWRAYDVDGRVTGVFWRDGATWRSSMVTDRIRRAALQGFSVNGGMDAWFDLDGGRAVYHGTYRDPNSGQVAEQHWIVHDLSTDVSSTTQLLMPSDDCEPLGGARHGEFSGDRIVALCDGTEYLLDPYDNASPETR